MSDLRHTAYQQIATLEADMKKLREYVKQEKASAQSMEAQGICTFLQASLLTVMNDCAAIRTTLSAAGTCGELRDPPATSATVQSPEPKPDRKSQAAGDHTLEEPVRIEEHDFVLQPV